MPAPVVARLQTVDGVVGLHGAAEDFDYACSKARAEAVDALLLETVEARGWTLFDDGVLERVSVEHDGRTRARIVVDGQPATPWWEDHVVRTEEEITWTFEPA